MGRGLAGLGRGRRGGPGQVGQAGWAKPGGPVQAGLAAVPFFQHGPVDEGPEGLELGGAAVLVVEVVGVLPDVEGEDGLQAFGDGVAGAGLLGDGEGAVRRGGEPDPAGAEKPDAFGDEVVLEGVEGTPLLDDLLHKFAGRVRRCRAGGELREVHVVVEDLAGVVEDGAVRLLDYLVQGKALVRAAGEEFIQVVDVSLEVLAVVEADGAGADHGLQRVVGIGELNESEHVSVV